MLAIFSNLVKKNIEVFMDDFSIYGDLFNTCLENLNIILKRCIEKKPGA